MTKEELKKEAIQYAVDYPTSYGKGYKHKDLRISYLAGAEPREKRIAELKAEVKEWKDKADLWCKTANLKDHNIMINKELERENAELKETLRTYNGCGDWDNDFHTCRVYLQREELQEYVEQLTKAKELLEELYDCIPSSSADYYKETLQKVVDFLKDSEVEKC